MFDPYEFNSPKKRRKHSKIAGAGRRLLASFIDWTFILVLAGTVYEIFFKTVDLTTFLATSELLKLFNKAASAKTDLNNFFYMTATIIFMLLYFTLSNWWFGSTIGKRAAGIRIVDDNYYDGPGIFQAISRTIAANVGFFLIPFIMNKLYTISFKWPEITPEIISEVTQEIYGKFAVLYLLIVVVNVAIIVFTKQKRTLHDRLAKTYVILRNEHE